MESNQEANMRTLADQPLDLRIDGNHMWREMSSRQYFDEVARKWDKMREMFFSETVREKAISVANVEPSRLAADIGAGTGFITEGLLRKGLRVIAVDQSDAMMNEIRRKFQGGEEIDCRVGEAEQLPIEDGAVDYVFANMYLHHVEAPSIAIREMARILKPGGILVVTDLDKHNFDFLRIEHHDRWLGFKREDVNNWFIEAGFKNVVIDCLGEKCCAQSSCGDTYASVSIFVASGKK